MTINTKYSLLDEVWFINEEKKAEKSRIRKIRFEISQNQQFQEELVYYTLDATFPVQMRRVPYTLKSDILFPSKEELLKSL